MNIKKFNEFITENSYVELADTHGSFGQYIEKIENMFADDEEKTEELAAHEGRREPHKTRKKEDMPRTRRRRRRRKKVVEGTEKRPDTSTEAATEKKAKSGVGDSPEPKAGSEKEGVKKESNDANA